MPPSFRRCCPVATARSHLKASPGPARRRRRPPILSSAFRPLCGNGCASWTPSGAEPGECCTRTDKSSPATATWAGRRGHGTSGREIAAVSPLGGTGVHATHSPPDPPGDVTVGAAPCAYQTGQSQCSTHCCAVDPYLQNPGALRVQDTRLKATSSRPRESRRCLARALLSPCSFELISRISSHSAVFFSHNKPANSTFSHNKPAKRTRCWTLERSTLTK